MLSGKALFFFVTLLVAGAIYAVAVIGLGSYYCWPNAEVLYLAGDVKASNVFCASEKLLQNYDGRYFTNLLHGLNPVAVGWLWGYKLMPIIGVILLLISVYFWLTSFVKISRSAAFAFSLAFITIHFALSPMIVSELFSMIGCYVYLYSMCFWMIWTGAFWRFITNRKTQMGNFWFFLSAMALVASSGCSEQVLMLNALTLLFLLLFFAFGFKEELPIILPLLAVGFISGAFFLSCPGWRIRLIMENPANNVQHPNIVFLSVEHYGIMLMRLFKKSGFMFSTFLLIYLTVTPVKLIFPIGSKWKGSWLAVSVFLFFFLSSYLMTFAYYLPMGNETAIPFRVFNPINTLLQLLFCVFFLCISPPAIVHRNSVKLILGCCCLIGLLFGSNNYQQICDEYRSGSYVNFDAKIRQRLNVLKLSQNSKAVWKKVCLEEFPTVENAIYHPVELQSNRSIDNRNIAFERYFGLDEVCFCSDTFGKADELIHILHD